MRKRLSYSLLVSVASLTLLAPVATFSASATQLVDPLDFKDKSAPQVTSPAAEAPATAPVIVPVEAAPAPAAAPAVTANIAEEDAVLEERPEPAPTQVIDPAQIPVTLPSFGGTPVADPANQVDIQEILRENIGSQFKRLEQDGVARMFGISPERFNEIEAFYEKRDFIPLWLYEGGLGQNGEILIETLSAAGEHGLSPADYNVARLKALSSDIAGASMETYADAGIVELLFTNSYLQYAGHLTSGRIDPRKVERENDIHPVKRSTHELLSLMNLRMPFKAVMHLLEPQEPSYRALKAELARLRAVKQAGDVDFIADGETLRPGMTSERVDAIRRRLAQEPYYVYDGIIDNGYRGDIVDAVKVFQSRNGLAVDGVVGKATLAVLNRPIEERMQMTLNNLERLRWYNRPLGGKYVDVNLADQTAAIVVDGEEVHRTRAVVGRKKYSTPVFSDEITYSEVNPYWNIPRSIAIDKYLPMLQKDSSATLRLGIKVFKNNKEIDPRSIIWSTVQPRYFDFHLRKNPGPRNDLGKVKYMFPNKHAIYLHDTPAKHLFDHPVRAYSRGCIRLLNPKKFGEVLLSHEPSSLNKLENYWKSKDTRALTLEESVPVHLRYITVFADKDGNIQYRNDLYGKDAKLEKLLQKTLRSGAGA
nr:L,D-transpeptidase family protein [Pseudovibrio flavus]